SKKWRYLVIAYVAICLVAGVIEHHGFERGPMSPNDRIFAAPILWALAVDAIQNGAVMGRLSWVDRSERPTAFWLIVIFETLYGLFLFGWGVRDSFRAGTRNAG